MEHGRTVGVGEVDRVELDVAFAADQIQRFGRVKDRRLLVEDLVDSTG